MIRAVIVAATTAILICMYLDRPQPVQSVEVQYCKVSYWRWIEIEGEKFKLWYDAFGPCTDQDIYRYI